MIADILAPTLYEEDADWLEEAQPQYYAAVLSALAKGHTPGAIYTWYMQQSPHRQALWLRVKHAAMHLQNEVS